MASAIYLFCLSDRTCIPEIAAGIAGDSQFLHQHGGIYALAMRVALDEFCGGEAKRRLEDPAWVTPRAIEHGRVIAEAFRCAPVLPVRFATLFSSEHALDEFIARNAAAIGRFLEDAREREEWGIKAMVDRRRLKRCLVAASLREPTDSISPGLRYIRERRAEQSAERELNGWLEQACESTAATISEHAVAIRRRAILDAAPQADGRETILNLAAFVARSRVDDLRRCVEEINAQREPQGLSFALTGPWPPYSFCPPLDAPP